MTDGAPAAPTRPSLASDRAATPVVGVVLLVGLTVLLASVAVAAVGFDRARPEPAPQVRLDADLSATDGWPEGQRLRLVHEGGDTLAVAELAVVVAFERADARARLSGFPTRRITDDHRRGTDLFDRTYAGVDGELDAAHADGRWTAGETASVRIAQNELDVRPGDRAAVRVIHRPSGAQLVRVEVRAS
ncbi:type IV pilin [Halosimplex pelagicum]|uniref:Type IV pilin n=1 Tax=Halosimplex pelagicum TaxID=869886 RepID=A0A7D5TFS8_9EURY|nr:type IV pilin [Halosimplex pelagicum]QLH80756.1 type IV pilin [Halosimplex pelagicum]